MTDFTGPTNDARPAPADAEPLAALALPAPAPQPAFAALAEGQPRLIGQLRGSLFAASFQNLGAQLTDGEVLRLAAAFYADDTLRAEIVEGNRLEGRPPLDLGIYADLLEERGYPAPATWDGLPEPLRLLDRALGELSPAGLLHNPLFVPSEELVSSLVANPYDNFAYLMARHPTLVPTSKLVAVAVASPDNDLARRVAQLPNLSPPQVQTLVAAAVSDPHSRLASGLALNPDLTPPQAQLLVTTAIEILYSTDFAAPDLNLLFSLAQNPNLPLDQLDRLSIECMMTPNPENNLSTCLARNHAFVPPSRFIQHAVEEPESAFARAIGHNPNLTADQLQGLVTIALENPSSNLASGVARNPNLSPSQVQALVAGASRNPSTRLARGLADNPAIVPPLPLIVAALDAPDTELAFVLAGHPMLVPPPTAVANALKNPDSELAVGVAQNPNLNASQVQDLVRVACLYPDCKMAEHVARIESLTPPQLNQLAAVALKNPDSNLAFGVARNSRLFTWGV